MKRAEEVSTAQEKKDWLYIETKRVKHDNGFIKDIREAFADELSGIISALKSGSVRDAKRVIKSPRNRTRWRKVYRSNYRRIIDEFGKVGADSIKSTYVEHTKATGFTFDPYERAISEWVKRTSAKRIALVFGTTNNKVLKVFEEGLTNGISTDELAKNLTSLYEGFDKVRAYTIARTEVAGASNYGLYQAGVQAPFATWKAWVNSHDDRVRESHDFRQRVQTREKFRNGLLYPADPEGSAAEVIKCRCTIKYERRRERDQ